MDGQAFRAATAAAVLENDDDTLRALLKAYAKRFATQGVRLRARVRAGARCLCAAAALRDPGRPSRDTAAHGGFTAKGAQRRRAAG
jgi:hypothetical protein